MPGAREDVMGEKLNGDEMFRKPLARETVVLREKPGMRTWWLQRVTSMILAAGAVLAAPVAYAQEADEVDSGAGAKKADKKASLLEEEKKVEAKKKKDDDSLKKGGFNYERLETLGFSKREQELQFKKSEMRKELIKTTERLLERTTDTTIKADLLFRLAENWWEETHYQYLLEMADFQKQSDVWEKLPENRRPAKPVQPVENYQRSITYYESILQQYPTYGRIDEVLFRLGKAALMQGKALGDKVLSNKGVQYLNQLVQKHQNSKYIAQTHLALAEHFFEANNLTLATQNFKTAAMYNYALYKLGWVYYNLREFRRTIDTFKAVVAEIGANNERGKIEFKDQALKDLVQAFAELDHGWPEAKEYFKGVEGEQKMWGRLEKMAEIYVATDKDDNAIELFTHFIENHPTDVRAVDWHESIVDVRKKIGNFPDTEKAMRAFLAFSDDRTSAWVAAAKRAGDKGNEALEKSARMGEQYLLYISNAYHQSAQKTQDEQKDLEKAKPLYAKAAADYKEFVRRYPKSKKAYIVSFYLAEILYDQLQDYKGSLEGYKYCIAMDPSGEYVEDAALGVLYSTEKLMAKTHTKWDAAKSAWVDDPTAPALMDVAEENSVQKYKKVKGAELTEEQIKAAQVPKKRQELHPLERDYVDAADKYVEIMFRLKDECDKGKKVSCGKGKKVPEIMYVAATTYYDRGQYDKAVERLEKVYNYQPENKVAEVAVKTMIDVFARHKDWAKIEDWARKMLPRKNRVVLETKDLRKYIAVSVAEQAIELAEKKDWDGAHKKYDTILAEFRKEEPELAATALYNKALLYELQKEDVKAITTYERVVKEFPKAKVGPEAMFQIGVIYESMTQFKDAADAFLNMAKLRDNADAAQALINAGAILNALQNYKDAAAAYDKFQTVAGNLKGDDARTKELKALIPEAEMEKGHVFEKMGAEGAAKAATIYQGIVTKFSARPDLQVEALGRRTETLRTADAGKNRKDVVKAADAAVAAFAKPEAQKGRAAYYAAQAQFYKTEYSFDDFDVVTLKGVKKMSALGPTLVKKADLLKKAEKDYFGVIDAASGGQGRAFAAASAYKIGMLYSKFKDDLFNAPIPPQILGTPLEEQYRQTIEKLAVPIEEQAVSALRNAINVSHNQGVYNKWSKEAGEQAAKISPDEYPTVEKDPNLPKATTAVSANKATDAATSAAFVISVRRGKFTVSFKPGDDKPTPPKTPGKTGSAEGGKPAAPQ
jgi:tetratricopeptide (TPR) repeat protein